MKQERHERLFGVVGEALRAHLGEGEYEREKVLEALSVLGMFSATMVAGTGDVEVLEWYLEQFFEEVQEWGERLGQERWKLEGLRASLAMSRRETN
jgi:hypothetical protein